MKTEKMSLANINGRLNRKEMKNIMAGSGSGIRVCVKCGCNGREILCCYPTPLATCASNNGCTSWACPAAW